MVDQDEILSLQHRLARAESELRLHGYVTRQFALHEGTDVALLQRVFDHVCETLGFDIFLLYDIVGPRSMRLAAWRGLTAQQRDHLSVMPFGAHLCGKVAERRERLVLINVQESAAPEAEVLCANGVRCYAGFPLMAQDIFLGTVAFASRERSCIDPDEIETLQGICDITALQLLRVQEANRQQERHRFITEVTGLVPGVIYVYDLEDQHNVFVTPQTGAVLGYDAEQAEDYAADFPSRLVHPDDAQRLARHIAHLSALEDGVLTEVDVRLRHADGSWRWFLARHVVYQRSADGTVRQVLGIATDITERKRAEASERRVQARFRRASAAAGALVYEADVESGAAIVHGAGNVLGESLQASTSAGWIARMHPGDAKRHLELLEQALASSGTRWTDRYRVRHADGAWRVVEDNAEIIRDRSGRAIRIVGTVIDVTARHTVLRDLHMSEERLRLATQAAGIGTFDVDIATGTIQRSARSAELAGSPGQTHISIADGLKHVHPDDAERIRARMNAALDPESDGFARVEVRLTQPDGTNRWQEFTLQTLFEDGATGRVPRRIVGVHVDTAERHAREVDLHRRAARQAFRVRLSDALRASPHEAAQAGCRLLGEFLGADRVFACDVDEGTQLGVVRSDWHRDGLGTLPATLALDGIARGSAGNLREGGMLVIGDMNEAEQIPLELRQEFATAGIASLVCSPLIEDGRVVRLLCLVCQEPRRWEKPDVELVREVGERTWGAIEQARAEEALREAEERFRVMADHAPVGIWVDTLDEQHFVNRAFLAFIGAASLPSGGIDWATCIHEGDREDYQAAYRNATSNRQRFEARSRFRRHDGEYRWMQAVGMPHYHTDGTCMGYVGTVVDITDVVRAEHLSAEAARQKDEFIAVLAHELRNPLAPIRTSVGILRLQQALEPVVARCRDIIERQVGQMARLLDDLLDVSRLSRGKLTLQRQLVRLGDVLDVAIETARPAIDDRKHELRLSPVERNVVLDADSARLAQVFANILNNAAKYTNPGGHIDIDVDEDERTVTVTVRDSGIGIAAGARERIFDLFAQGGESRERSDSGLGIGLALSRRLVEMHGGTIAVESDGIGRGTSFMVTLPHAARRERATSAAGAASRANPETTGAKRRVLVADDNIDAADTIAMLLESWGCEVRTAYDGAGALTAAESFVPDLVLLDLGMPGMSGQTVCNRMRGTTWGVGIVIAALTGWGQEEDRRRTKALGFDHHLVKPADPEVLRKLVRSI